MTVSVNENTSNSYIANGTETQFEIRFKWYEADEVKVKLDDVVQSSGFSVVVASQDPDQSNDSDVEAHVVFDSAPAASTVVLLEQDLNVTQDADFLAFGKFPADKNERALDKMTLLIRKLSENLRERVIATTAPARPGRVLMNDAVDGVNTDYTIDSTAVLESIKVEVYGNTQHNWTYSAGVVTLGFAPVSNGGNEVTITYEKPSV